MKQIIKATLILADDHPLFIKGLKAILQKKFTILGIAADGRELMELACCQKPDAIVIDLQMPFVDGLTAAKLLADKYPYIKLIILSAFYDCNIANELKQIGVRGYLTKDLPGDFYFVFHRPVLQSFSLSDNALKIFLTDHAQKLSIREIEIVSLIRTGLTTNEISKRLFISINTVETHRKNIYKKLGLKNVQGLVEFAYKNSL